MATMASTLWRGHRFHFLVALHGKKAPADPEWDAYCALQANCDAPERLRGLTITMGGAPNRAQRKRVLAVHAQIGSPASAIGSVVTDSVLVRGICATFTWFGIVQGLRMFPLCNIHAGLDWAGATRGEKGELLADLTQLGDLLDDHNPIRFALEQSRRRA
jgi:hypothetical protein